MTIDPNALDTLTHALRYYSVAETAWQRRVALDIYRATATPALVGALVAEHLADAPTTAELDDIAAQMHTLAARIEAYGANQPATAGYVAVISVSGDNIQRREHDMAFVLQIGQEVDLTVSYQDQHGNAAEVESQTWTSSDDTVVGVTDIGDGAAVATAATTGTAQVQLVADARFGDEVAEIRAVLDVEVVAAEAVTAVITPGAPRGAGEPDDGEPDDGTPQG